MKKGKGEKKETEKDKVNRVKKAIVKYKESETMSKLGIEAKQLSEKLEGVTVSEAKSYLFAKHQKEMRKEKFVRARNILLKIWAKLQTFAERYEKTQERATTSKTGKGKKDKTKDELTNYAENVMKEWKV